MRTLKELDKAYIAGIVDGEGCITIVRSRKNPHHAWDYSPQCTVTNTVSELCHWLRDITNVGAVNDRPKEERRKQSYRWYLRSYEMVEFLEVVTPFLMIKKRQAEILLEFLKSRRASSRHDPLTETEVEARSDLYHEIRALNERGER